MEHWLSRTEYLIGKDHLEKLKNSHVAIFGCGGVGSYTIEALCRSGIGHLTIVDKDVVDVTNINRQLIADVTTVGKLKVEVCKQRLLRINPDIAITAFPLFYDTSTADELFNFHYDYIVDAIDTVSSKLSLIEEAKSRHIPIISCMGTGNKLDPTQFEVTNITKTSVCPLAKVMRKELGKRGITDLKVVYSKETPCRLDEDNKRTPSSISFVPSVAGLIIAGEVIKDLMNI